MREYQKVEPGCRECEKTGVNERTLPIMLLTLKRFIIIMLLIVNNEGRAGMTRNAISLFSSSGIGDLGLKANGIDTIIGCELLAERMNLFHNNYPNAECFQGDIWALKDEIIDYYNATYMEPPFLILATPPCQGIQHSVITV